MSPNLDVFFVRSIIKKELYRYRVSNRYLKLALFPRWFIAPRTGKIFLVNETNPFGIVCWWGREIGRGSERHDLLLPPLSQFPFLYLLFPALFRPSPFPCKLEDSKFILVIELHNF